MLGRLLAGLTATLLLTGGAAAAPRPVQAGDVYRYASDVEKVREGGSQPYRQTDRFIYDLEVLEVRADGLTLRFTIRDAQAADSRIEMGPFVEPFVGLPFDVETGSDFAPLRLVDWPGHRQALLARMQPYVRVAMVARLGKMEGDPALLAEEFTGDLKLFSGFQNLGSAPVGCRVRSERQASGRVVGASTGRYTSRSSAVVSSDDGWVLEATQAFRNERPDGSVETTTVKVRRQSPQAIC